MENKQIEETTIFKLDIILDEEFNMRADCKANVIFQTSEVNEKIQELMNLLTDILCNECKKESKYEN